MSIDLQRIHEAFSLAAQKLGLEPLDIGKLRVERCELRGAEALAAWLDQVRPTRGWMLCQSAHWLMRGPGERPGAEAGSWIEGEFSCEDGAAARFAHQGAGCWTAVRFIESEGDPCLLGRFSVRGTRGAPGRLRYHRYWVMEGGAPRVLACAFRGFEEAAP
jgi:hypothetical protein